MTLTPEDEKLVTLARASRARTHSPRGAAVRDLDGRIVDLSTVREMAGKDVPVYLADDEGTIVSIRAS